MPEPQYERIARTLRDRITSGELRSEQRLPTERELMDEFEVSVTVARAALAQLRSEGLVYSQQGRGSFVRDFKPLRRWTTNRYARNTKPPFKREAEHGGWSDEVTSSISTVVCSDDVARRLRIEPGEPVSQVVYHWYGSKELVQISTQWEPLRLTRGTEIESPSPGEVGKPDVITRFDKIDINVTHVQELITGRMPTPEEAREFQLTTTDSSESPARRRRCGSPATVSIRIDHVCGCVPTVCTRPEGRRSAGRSEKRSGERAAR